MTVTEVLPTLRQLNRADKIRVVQFLVNEIAREEEIFFEEGKSYPVWSPFESHKAAEQLVNLLEEEKTNV
jgi:hypothetical protein